MYSELRAREDAWWASRDPAWLSELEERGLTPANCRYAGEVFMCVVGLKPVVCLCHFAADVAASYMTDVLGGILTEEVVCFALPRDGMATEVYDFGGEFVVVNRRHGAAAVVAAFECLRGVDTDHPIPADLATQVQTDAFWATAFDYPISLDDMAPAPASASAPAPAPSPASASAAGAAAAVQDDEEEAQLATLMNEPDLLEIGYTDSAHGNALLTMYGAAHTPALLNRAMQHYQRYRAVLAPHGIKLQMELRPVG
jgi:hypothetical protein